MKAKRILSLVLCILMVLSTMSFTVLAEEPATLADLISKAEDGGIIELAEGTHTMPNNVSNKNITIKGSKAVVVEMLTAVNGTNSTINFNGVTVKFDNDNYEGIQHSKKITYTNCDHIGTEFLYAAEVAYTGCTFEMFDAKTEYAVWTYGAKDVKFNDCVFNTNGKAVLVYTEAAHEADIDLANCTFKSNGTYTGKAAVELGESANGNTAEYTVKITESSADSNFVANNTESNLLGNKNDMNLDLVEGENGFTATAVTYDIDDFKADLAESKDTEGNYVFDGEGKTYKWTIGNTVNRGDKNAPDRYNSSNAQYYLLNGETGSVTMKNVNFVFTAPNGIVSGNIIGSGNTVGAAQLYFENTGDFTVENCKFEKTVLTNFYGAGNSSVTDCTFTNIDNSYAVKDIRGESITVSSNTFKNCSGGIMVSAVNDNSEVKSVIVKDNEFTNVSADGKDRGLIQLAKAGVYADDAVSYENNTATDCGSTFRLLNESAWTDVIALVDNSNGALTLTADSTVDRVAMIGTNVYKSLNDAIEAAKEGDVIKLLTDIEIETGEQEGLKAIADKSITIDGKNTYKVTATGDGVSTVGVSNGTLTLQNLTLVDKSVSYAESAWEFAYLEIGGNLVFDNVIVADPVMFDNAKATVKNSTFTGKTVDGLNMYGAWVQGGNVTFTGCTFNGTRGIKACDEYSATVEALTVDGCTFNDLTQKPGIALDIDTGAVEIVDNTFISTEVFETTTAIDITFVDNTVDGVAYAPYVAEVDGVKYYSLAYALDAVLTSEKADMTLTLLKDLDLTDWTSVDVKKAITLDGNGKTITGLTKPLINNASANLVIKDLTITGANIEIISKTGSDNDTSAAALIQWANGGTLTLNNVSVKDSTIKGEGYAAALVGFIDSTGSGVVINGGEVSGNTVTAGGIAAAVNALTYKNIEISDVVVSGNTLTSTSDDGTRPDKVGAVVGRICGDTTTISATVDNTNKIEPAGEVNSYRVVGTITAETANVVINGGSYPSDPTKLEKYKNTTHDATIADTFILKENNNTYNVVPMCAKIGETEYETFAGAVNAVENNGTVTIIHKVEDMSVSLSSTKTFTVVNSTGDSIIVKVNDISYTIENNAQEEITYTYVPSRPSGNGGSSTRTYTIKFNTNGGNTIKNVSVESGSKLNEPAVPEKEGFIFEGWYTDKELNTKYDFDKKVTKAFTLYAKWTEKPEVEILLTIGKADALVNGETVTNDVVPIIVNDRTMLPIRFIAEALGAKVEWFEETETVKITLEDIEISLVIGESFATVNGEKVELDSPSFIENDRTYLPIRFVAENLGAKVDWDEALQLVTITK